MLPSLRSKSGNVTETPTTAWVRPSSLSRFAHKLNAQSGCFLLRSTSTAALRCSTRRRLSRTPGAWSACVMSVAASGRSGRRSRSARTFEKPGVGAPHTAARPWRALCSSAFASASSSSALACSTLAASRRPVKSFRLRHAASQPRRPAWQPQRMPLPTVCAPGQPGPGRTPR